MGYIYIFKHTITKQVYIYSQLLISPSKFMCFKQKKGGIQITATRLLATSGDLMSRVVTSQ